MNPEKHSAELAKFIGGRVGKTVLHIAGVYVGIKLGEEIMNYTLSLPMGIAAATGGGAASANVTP